MNNTSTTSAWLPVLCFATLVAGWPLLSRAGDPAQVQATTTARLLDDAREFQQVGRYHLAQKRWSAVLLMDPQNAEAKAGEKQTEEVLKRREEQSFEIRPARELYYPVYPVVPVYRSGK